VNTSAKKTILVVDDREDDIQLLNRMFKRARILNPVHAVQSVEDAICYLTGEGVYSDRETYPFPALILVDLHLPDGSGFDVLRWIKKHSLPASLAVVVLSGSDVHAFRQAYELGAHSFLTKPLKFEDFHNMVTHVRGLKLTTSDEGRLVETE
jgi:CheY-like chemotaxis protein